MKKLLSIILTLVMALSCASALGQEAVPQATETVITLSVNRDFALMLTGSIAAEGDTTITDTVTAGLDMIDKLKIRFVEDDANALLALDLGDTSVLRMACAADATGGYVITSDLFPTSVLTLTAQEIAELLQRLEATEGAQDPFAELELLFGGYLADAQALMEKIQTRAQPSQDGTGVLYDITSYDTAELAAAWAARFEADEALQAYLGEAASRVGAMTGETIDFSAFVTQLNDFVTQTRAQEEMVIATCGLYAQEDGSSTLELDIGGMMLLTVDTQASGDISARAIMSAEGTTDWQATYDAIIDGTNTTDDLIELSLSQLDGNSFALDITSGGMVISLAGQHKEGGEGDDYLRVASLEAGMMGLQVLSLGLYTIPAEPLTAPATEGLTPISMSALLAQDEAAMNAFSLDMMNYGLPTLLTNAQTAMPEQVTLLLTLLINASQDAAQTPELGE